MRRQYQRFSNSSKIHYTGDSREASEISTRMARDVECS